MATYKPLQSSTLTTTATSFTFSGIDQGYSDLVLVMNLGAGTAGQDIYCQVNGDTASNYSHTRLLGNGTAASSSRGSSLAYMRFSDGGSPQTTANSFTQVSFINYSNTTTNKTVLNRASNGNRGTDVVINLWRSTAAITSITVYMSSGNITAGSTFSLYGIKSGAPQAFGGDVVTTDGNYWYHLFTTTGSFTPLQNLSADVLAIAGGAGGGADRGAGGGAGGLLYLTSQTLSAGAKTVQVGGGGAGGSGGNSPGAAGTNSFVGSLTAAVGGGSGTGGSGGNGGNGGSGGGGGGTQGGNFTGGTATSGQGFAGGNGRFDSQSIALGSGGGGGAGAVGANGTTSSGAGGTGVNTYSSWITATGSVVGTGGYICGGGGGGSNSGGGSAGAGGAGGGGAGGSGGAGSAATVRTGSGGGGGSNSGGQSPGGAGASGFVIVRYPV